MNTEKAESSAGFHTRTGSFPIGFRRMGGDWSADTEQLAQWMRKEGFGVLDLTAPSETDMATLALQGIAIGSIDLQAWPDYSLMLARDKAARDEAVRKAIARIRACSAAGPRIFFTLMLTPGEDCSAKETFGFMIESYGALIPVLKETGSRIAIEGWPEHQAHCCNPESYRAFLNAIGSPAFGINYDPSHLIRLGIDHVRFLREFAAKVFHVHGKDTEIFPEKLYELGWEQNLAKMDGSTWRYTIPGHGEARWPLIFQILKESGYAGAVCIEHEDAVFSGSEKLEQEGLLHAAGFLATC
jgi:sugar phosphate isomerase/epimerase